MLDREKFVSEMQAIAETVARDDKAVRGRHIEARVQRVRIVDCARLLLSHGFYLNFISAVHVSPEIELVYQFGHFDAACVVMLKVAAGEDKNVPSIAGIFQGAAWYEREAHEFFGLIFPGHPNLKPLILSREERDFHPLVKDEKRLKSFADIFAPEPPPPPKAD